MDEIKVGEYVKTTDGIFKVTKIDGLYIYLDKQYFDNQYQTMRDVTFKERIVKHSFNIIDLIEVGDFINGERILDITGDYIHTNETDHNKFYLEKHIKRILTKKQYERNCYVLEGR